MNELPGSVQPVLRRLSRRLAIGLFLDVWPAWAAAGLFLAGLAALVCRLFLANAAPYLRWLWLIPLLTVVPVLFVCLKRTYRDDQVVALADSLGGGEGVLLTLLERNDRRWAESPAVERAANFALPRLRPWRRLAPLAPAVAFLATALWLPQRMPLPGNAVLADDIAQDLESTLEELKQQQLITPEEEKKLEEEIERIRQAADERVDASSWEAADALREKVIAGLSEKQDAVKWAEASLHRYAAATQGGAGGSSDSQAEAAELTEAIEKLAQSGLLAGAPEDLKQLLRGGKLPADAKALREITSALSKYLAETKGRFGEIGRLGREFGRFDPAEFPVGSEGEVEGTPGRGDVTRGRGDAPLTWGDESLPLDRFKAQALPPGAPRSPDDWAPLVEMPGAPKESAVMSTSAAARTYAGAVGQTAWRRTLAPRHQSAVKKYFAHGSNK